MNSRLGFITKATRIKVQSTIVIECLPYVLNVFFFYTDRSRRMRDRTYGGVRGRRE